jgi:hypothetical protein
MNELILLIENKDNLEDIYNKIDILINDKMFDIQYFNNELFWKHK